MKAVRKAILNHWGVPIQTVLKVKLEGENEIAVFKALVTKAQGLSAAEKKMKAKIEQT